MRDKRQMIVILCAAALAAAGALTRARASARDSERYVLAPLAEAAVSDPLGLWYQLGCPGPLEQLGEQDELLIVEDLDPEPFTGGVW